MRPSDLPERFAAKIEVVPSGCWLWIAGAQTQGYGHFWNEGRMVLAHRFAYEHLVGEIPAGLTLDHVRERGCTSRLCVNPEHLEPVTYSENSHRGEHPKFVAHREGRCTRGHPAEFYRRKSGPRKGQTVYCLACKREERAVA